MRQAGEPLVVQHPPTLPLMSEFGGEGFRLAFSRYGQGARDVVFIHGLYSASTLGVPLIEELSRGTCVWAPDLPGHGRSGPFPQEMTVDEAARGLAAFIHAECRTPVAGVIGYSMGGVVALRLIGREPEISQSLALISTPSLRRPLPWWALGMGSPLTARPVGALMTAAARIAYGVTGLGRGARDSESRTLLRGALMAGRHETIGLIQSACALNAEDIANGMGNTPAMILAGTHDRVIRPPHALELNRVIPGSCLHWLSGTDHLAPYTDAPRVARYIRAFLKRTAEPAGNPH